MVLKYKQNLGETLKYWDAFWEGQIIDRPLVCITSPRKGCETAYKGHGITYKKIFEAKTRDDSFSLMKSFEDYLQNTAFLGEAIPFLMLDYGPDMFASFFGAELLCSDSVDTTWVKPIVTDWNRFDGVMEKGEGTTYNNYLNLLKYATEYSKDKFLISVPDIHSNMDTLSALRGPQDLCYDIMDFPDEVEQALKRVRASYKPFYDDIYKVGEMDKHGCIGWIPTYSKERFATVQCDYAGLIGPEHGLRYVIPSIRDEVSCLDHVSYHYDGKQALVHLDNILDIEGIDVIQWVPGDGSPRSIEWMDLLKKIQKAGKGLWIYDWTIDEIKANFKELDPQGLVFSVDAPSEDKALELLEFLKKNT